MMMIGGGERERETRHPTVQVPPWEDYLDDPTVNMLSPYSVSPSGGNGVSPFDSLTALHRYLPSNVNNSFCDEEYDEPVDAFACDHFRMYEFKVRRCARGRSHDWTECPYAHPGEKARRRDPRKFIYSGNSCPEFRKGQCLKGDLCEYAHGVFECWLHPSRYRTQPCKDGTHCRRRVCFFAHTPDQLRIPSPRVDPGPESYDGSPGRVLYSPPDSPSGSNSVNQLVSSINNLQIEKKSLQMGMGVGMGMSMSPPSWGGFCSPRSPSTLRPAFLSMPTTPTRGPIRSGLGVFDIWDKPTEEEPVMERVESGRDLRARIYAKLSRENSVGRGDPGNSGPDVGWISELVK